MGEFNFSLGTGVFESDLGDFTSSGSNTISKIGPFYWKLEAQITHHFALGFSTAYLRTRYETLDSDATNFRYSNLSIMLRLNFFALNMRDFKLYSGFGIGYKGIGKKDIVQISNEDEILEQLNLQPLAIEFTAGIRYFLTDDLGIYTEIGVAKSVIQPGVVYSFYSKNRK